MNFVHAFVGHCPEMVELVVKPAQEMKAEVQDFFHRVKVLSGDVDKCNQSLRRDSNNQFWRRTLVRNVFVLLEACSYGLKTTALHRSKHFDVDFTPAELAMLSEEKYYLDGGEAKTGTGNFQKFAPNLRFAFKSFAKSYGFEFELSLSNAPLTDCENLRNRITHPKRLSELSVTDNEIESMARLWKWFDSAFGKLMEGVMSHSLPVSEPRFNLKKRFTISGRYLVILLDGYLYQFDKRKDANALVRAHRKKGEVSPPLIFKTSDLFETRSG